MTARELKNETGKALLWASRGERVLVTRRGKPVAWLVPAEEPASEPDADTAWKEVLDSLARQEPAFPDWQSATDWVRGRS